jgi:4-hydroxymandelate oxidase
MALDFADWPQLSRAAAEALPADIFAYLNKGAGAGRTLAANEAAWGAIRLRPHILRAIDQADISTTLLGCPLAMPLLIAPTGRATRFHAEGELAQLKGAAQAGGGVVLPSSVVPFLPALARASQVPFWQQLYFMRDRAALTDRIALAAENGCRAIVLTVDLLPDCQSAPPPPAAAAWETHPHPLRHSAAEPLSAGLDDLAWLCARSPIPVVVKGVLRGDDAQACVAAGAAGLIVSNHGGNQLDTVIATADALRAVIEAIDGKAEILVDGGIRNGAAILKALALGARGVLIGRPAAYGLAAGGAEGVGAVMGMLAAQLSRAMALCGASRIADLAPDLLAG